MIVKGSPQALAIYTLAILGGAYLGYHTVAPRTEGTFGVLFGAAGGWLAAAGVIYADTQLKKGT